MSFDVRRVPANWEHPTERTNTGENYLPLLDQSFIEAVAEWKASYAAWERGERPSYFRAESYSTDLQYWEYECAPPSDRSLHRPDWTQAERTHYQLYESVSEGTPVSRPMPSIDALAEWLANNKVQWGAMSGPLDKAGWLKVCEAGGACSMVSGPGIGVVSGAEYIAQSDDD